MKKMLLLTAVGFSVGCVSSGKYDAAVAELNACKADDQNQKDSLAQLEKQKSDAERRLKELTAQLADLGQRSAQLQSEKGNLADNMAKLQAELAQVRKQEEAARQRVAMFQGLVARLKGMIDSGQLSVSIRNGRMLVNLPDNVLFDPGKTDIKPKGKDALANLTTALQAIEARRFQVAGHTDNTPIHTARFPSNWELSTARAVVVVNFMIKSGMEPQRLTAAGFAQYDPVVPNDTPEGKARNRRIEVELLPNLEELPKLDDASPTAAR